MFEWLAEQLSIQDMNGGLWIQLFLIVFIALTLAYIANRVLKHVEKNLTSKSKTFWDDALAYAIRRPIQVILGVLALSFIADIIDEKVDSVLFQIIDPARELGVLIALGWALLRFISRAEKDYIKMKQLRSESYDRTTIDAVTKLLRISVFISIVLIALQTLGFSISGVLAFGGIGGIAIGFAARDLLSNFFGAAMIYMDRPFNVGDWIRSPDREIEGDVEKIGWRITTIRTFDKRPLYVPNSVFVNIAVENPQRMQNRRIKEYIGVRYDDLHVVKDIVADIKSMLQNHQEIDTGKTLIVNMDVFNASSIDILVYTFTKTTNWVKFHEVKQDVMLTIADIIEKHGAEIAFPTRTLHLADEEFPKIPSEPAKQTKSSPKSGTSKSKK